MNVRALIVMLAVTLAVATLPARDFPTPPDGFVWQEIPAIKGAILVPEGWSFASETGEGTLAYFVTKESFDPYKRFLTGVTLGVLARDEPAAAQLRDEIVAEGKRRAVQVEPGSFGPLKRLQIRFDVPATKSHPKTRVVRVAITNSKTGTAYDVKFESPVEDWERTWPKGHAIISNLALNWTF